MRSVLLAAAVAATAFTAPALAHEVGPDTAQKERYGASIEVMLDVQRSGDRESVKRYTATLTDGGKEAFLNSGARIPIPTKTVNETEDGKTIPVTTFTYQNVGFTARLRANSLADRRIRVTGSVSDSRVRPGTTDPTGKTAGRPVTETFEYQFDVAVPAGKPVEVLRFRDPQAGEAMLVLTAKPVR